MRRYISTIAAALLLAFQTAAYAQPASKVQGVGTASTPGGGAISVNCLSGCGSGTSGNATIVGPVGSQASADGVSVTIASDQAAVAVKQSTAANLNATVVGTGTFATQLTGATNNINNISGTVALPTGASTLTEQQTINTSLGAINTTLGTPFQAGGSIGNTSFIATQATAANFNATVVGTGVFVTQATLEPGASIIGKVGIDQTTPGTTNGVVVNSSTLPTGAATSALQTSVGATAHTDSGTINATLGTPMQATGGTVQTVSGSVTNMSPAARTIVPLDVSTVTTGGAAVTALNAGHRAAGGFLYNPIGATINLCIDEQGAASGTTSAGALTCIQPGQIYTLAPTAGAVSVITADSSHPFSGYGLN